MSIAFKAGFALADRSMVDHSAVSVSPTVAWIPALSIDAGQMVWTLFV